MTDLVHLFLTLPLTHLVLSFSPWQAKYICLLSACLFAFWLSKTQQRLFSFDHVCRPSECLCLRYGSLFSFFFILFIFLFRDFLSVLFWPCFSLPAFPTQKQKQKRHRHPFAAGLVECVCVRLFLSLKCTQRSSHPFTEEHLSLQLQHDTFQSVWCCAYTRYLTLGHQTPQQTNVPLSKIHKLHPDLNQLR